MTEPFMPLVCPNCGMSDFSPAEHATRTATRVTWLQDAHGHVLATIARPDGSRLLVEDYAADLYCQVCHTKLHVSAAADIVIEERHTPLPARRP